MIQCEMCDDTLGLEKDSHLDNWAGQFISVFLPHIIAAYRAETVRESYQCMLLTWHSYIIATNVRCGTPNRSKQDLSVSFTQTNAFTDFDAHSGMLSYRNCFHQLDFLMDCPALSYLAFHGRTDSENDY